MLSSPDPKAPTYDELREELARVRGEFAAYRVRAENEIAELKALVEKLMRQTHRPTAPFSRDNPSPKPKTPGRKRGKKHGPHAHRAIPDKIDDVIEVPLPDCCPKCDSQALTKTDTATQYQSEIETKVIVRQFNISLGQCGGCGASVRGRHEWQTSEALGAAGSQFGANVHKTLAVMNKELGLPLGKCRRLLMMLFPQLTMARATVYRSTARTASRLERAYEGLRQDVRGSPLVSPDETGMRIGGGKGWLHVAVGNGGKRPATVYETIHERDSSFIVNLLGLDWRGHLIRDGWSPYNALTQARHQMCLQHIQRRCRGLLETAKGRARGLGTRVLSLIDEAFAIRREGRGRRLDNVERIAQAWTLFDRWNDLLSGRWTYDPNRKLAKHLNSHDATEWFSFLLFPKVPATNYLSEQAIRPAVVNRKVWGGFRTAAGAKVGSVLTSVIATCKQRLFEPANFLREAICSATSLLVPAGR